ncbi:MULTISPECIES: hypothetical protein [Pseudoalteromonas]|uniref:ABM domain-containing protein n=1 Tax=Pseudoalteromonas luteoviolacea (strain 2ta16) TaxID=1353533 RepID=V4J699_PSEL2|nr:MULTISPECIES: hypothetical protein [Pseudoalteromonas]ESP90827.1 hypothetical protein PL2TA16_01218 [Pseudoalteromonas luteoviolacea 2ta16]KZN38415.1 hypothetical protein N483_20880 [Pseudoalteromonas luteoviolacea NCIMB 1944]MCG7547843.1 hypothetical protein [Pseudoalteromonas sp. Of7M-16]
MSVKVIIECQLSEVKSELLDDFLTENVPAVKGFAGCQRVSISFDENKTTMLIDEDWQSVEHHKNYMQFIDSNGVLKGLIAFMSAPPRILYFRSYEY